MKKKSLRVISVFICLTIILSCFNMSVTAKDNEEAVNTNDYSFEADNALGIALNNISGKNNNNTNYGISKIELENNIATVSLTNIGECKLIVAIYEETSERLLGTGISNIQENVGSTDVKINIVKFPQFFLIKAFLVDENNASLCKPYINKEHTQAFKTFFEKEPSDYSGKTVLIFDDSKDVEDFAVLKDEVKVSSNNDKMSFSFNENSNKYVFYNANADVKNLSVGDVFYWKYGMSDEYVLLKAKSVTKSGTSVTVEQDDNVALEELFSFVRVDDDSDFSNYELTQENMGEAMELVENENQITTQAEVNKDDSSSYSTEFTIKYPKTEEGADPSLFSAKVEGSGKLSFTTHVKIYYDVILFGKDYYEFESTTQFTGEISVKASGSMDFTPFLTLKAIPSIPIGTTGITIKIEPAIVFKVTASISLSASLGYTVTVTANTDNGLQKSQESKFSPKIDLKDKIEVKVGIQVKIKVEWVGSISLSVTGEGGAKLPLEPTTVGAWFDKFHDCIICLDGEIDLYASISGKLELHPLKLFNMEWTIVTAEWSWKKCDFYFSINSDGIDCGEGDCKRISHRVSVKVLEKDKSGNQNPLRGATVSCATCKCDSNGDKKYDENAITTNESGEALIYCKPGTHSITVSANGYSTLSQTVKVLHNPNTVTFVFGKSQEDDPNDPIPSDGDIKWIFTSSNNTLTISGNGSMKDYSTFDTAPWLSSYKEKIQKVKIEKGVKNIGNYAFAQCTNLESVSIADTVTKIGTAAFYECNSLQTITLPSNVLSVGDYAFYDCYSLSKFEPGSVETIGMYAFAQCDALKSVVFPSATKNIGDSAFAWCDNLKSITINNKNCTVYNDVNTIPDGTTIYAPSGSNAQSYANKYGRNFGGIQTASVTANNTNLLSFSFSSCKPGNDYILLNVTGYGNGFELTTSNLEFIDQLTADTSGKVSSSFIPRNYYSNSTTLLIGDFGNGIEQKVITVTLGRGSSESNKKLRSVDIGNDISLIYKGSAKINPIIDADTGINTKVEFKSSNNDVVTVDQNGNIYGTNKWTKSTATITCTATDDFGNSVTDTCDITVGFSLLQWIAGVVLFGWIWL